MTVACVVNAGLAKLVTVTKDLAILLESVIAECSSFPSSFEDSINISLWAKELSIGAIDALALQNYINISLILTKEK